MRSRISTIVGKTHKNLKRTGRFTHVDIRNPLRNIGKGIMYRASEKSMERENNHDRNKRRRVQNAT